MPRNVKQLLGAVPTKRYDSPEESHRDWVRKEIEEFRDRVYKMGYENGIVDGMNRAMRLGAQNMNDPEIRLWVVSVYQFCKEVLEKENLA